ncbi:MAG: hypothetical protein H0T75_06830 [Rhizobiales bacterium]|nr:hypothetical protein [Hyphomicrobiales bacterium]
MAPKQKNKTLLHQGFRECLGSDAGLGNFLEQQLKSFPNRIALKTTRTHGRRPFGNREILWTAAASASVRIGKGASAIR